MLSGLATRHAERTDGPVGTGIIFKDSRDEKAIDLAKVHAEIASREANAAARPS